MRRARFIVEPELFIRHTAQRIFIGPGAARLRDGSIFLAAPWGRPPTNFEQLTATHPVPHYFHSNDGGRTFADAGPMRMDWPLTGMISDGGFTFLSLRDGRLACLAHRHVLHLHGGGLPAIAFSCDDGATWSPARAVGGPEGVWYVMNDRLIEMKSGRLVVPVACADAALGGAYYEGARSPGLCFFSDDGGATWRRSRRPAILDDERGMAEPSVLETADGRLLMLARTGSGSKFQSWSDDGGDTWSTPAPTTLRSGCSPHTLLRLPDGRPILFYNHAEPIHAGAFFPRTPLTYAVSPDDGKSWEEPVVIVDEGMEKKDRQLIYPTVVPTPEGLLVVFSEHAADPSGSFANGGAEGWKIGGGKRCIIATPE